MKRFCSLLTFLLFFFFFSFFNTASGNTIYWGETYEAPYDLSIPGSKYLWSDPLANGGMNLRTGKMTSGKDADIAFSPNGYIGARKIVDLGQVDFNSVIQPGNSLFDANSVNAIKGHVYTFELLDGTLAKLYIVSISSTQVKIRYALEAEEELPEITSIKFSEKLKYSPSSIKLTVKANYSDGTTVVIKNGVNWRSSNTSIATVKNGQVTFTGKPGKVTITATYNGKSTSATVTVGNVAKSLSTKTKLSYSNKPINIKVTATYMNGTKKLLHQGLLGNLVIRK